MPSHQRLTKFCFHAGVALAEVCCPASRRLEHYLASRVHVSAACCQAAVQQHSKLEQFPARRIHSAHASAVSIHDARQCEEVAEGKHRFLGASVVESLASHNVPCLTTRKMACKNHLARQQLLSAL